jgi:hypothetical protein
MKRRHFGAASSFFALQQAGLLLDIIYVAMGYRNSVNGRLGAISHFTAALDRHNVLQQKESI